MLPNGLGFEHPPLTLIIGGHQHEQVMKFRQRGAHSEMVVGFAPSFISGLKQFLITLTHGSVAGTSFIEISRAFADRQPPGSAKDGQFVIRRIRHVQTALPCTPQCENPEQKPLKRFGCLCFKENEYLDNMRKRTIVLQVLMKTFEQNKNLKRRPGAKLLVVGAIAAVAILVCKSAWALESGSAT